MPQAAGQATMGLLEKGAEMTTKVLRRPEVQLATCPEDGGTMFRQYWLDGAVWWCPTCGHVSYKHPMTGRRMAA